jgi:hypothetical protein
MQHAFGNKIWKGMEQTIQASTIAHGQMLKELENLHANSLK